MMTWVRAQALPAASERDGHRYAVMSLEVEYEQPNPPLPPVKSLLGAAVKLGRTEGGYVAWREGLEATTVRLDSIGNLPDFMIYDSAIDLINRTILDELSQRGLKDAKVKIAPGQFDEQGKNLRGADDFNLKLQIAAGTIPAESHRIPVTNVELRYNPENLVLPPLKPMLGNAVTLGLTEGGYVAYREGLNGVKIPMNGLDHLPDFMLFSSAIDAMSRTIEGHFEQRGIKDVKVKIAADQIADGKDLRQPGDYRLTLEVNVPATGVAQVESQRYPVMGLQVAYAQPEVWLPRLETILNAPVKLGRTENGFMAFREGLDNYRVKLAQLGELPDFMMFRSSLDSIMQAIVDEFGKNGFVGVKVSIPTDQIAEDGADKRGQGNYGLTMVIDTSNVRSSATMISAADGKNYPVKSLEIAYTTERGKLPDPNVLMDVTVALAATESGLSAYRPGLVRKDMKLAEIAAQPETKLYGSAIKAINESIVSKMNQLGFFGVIVAPAQGQFDETGNDTRGEADQTLKISVRPGVVQDIRTVASGDRVGDAEKVNNPAYQRIAENSPVKKDDASGGNVLNRSELDRYVQFLNRHPGRRVDVAVAAGDEPGNYVLDYLVQDSKQWLVYAQGSNTGTSQTDKWRERFGFVHNQLTNHDDILKIDYVTSGFKDSHAVVGSYEAPVPTLDRLRWQVNGTYSEYVASDVGIFDQRFSGKTSTFGGQLSWNFLQSEDLFVDLVAGIVYQSTEVKQETLGTTNKAEAEFLRPSVGLTAQRQRTIDSFSGSATFETNLSDAAGTDEDALRNMGRAGAEADYVTFRWDLNYSTYLEPWLRGQQNNLQPEITSLVHEISFSFRGQQALDDARLASQLQYTAGGLYTVRGYKEAATVGDDAMIGSAEYRVHVPRMLAFGEPSKVFNNDFRFRPTNEYGWPDWDLIGKVFIDYGKVSNNTIPTVVESAGEELLGAGVGVELQIKRNFNLRVDWGWALKDVPGTTEGSSQIHIVGTILY